MSYEKPLVSVHMITYNHEKFIAQAIEGVLMQKTDFPFELIIGEDCSTDRTREIVVDYANRYPEIIKPILHEKNVGAKANSKSVREACTGKYVAVCEGDDYWIDPLKLQKQVDFLEAHRDFSGCHTRYKVVSEQNNEMGISALKKNPLVLEEVIVAPHIASLTYVYRSNLQKEMPDFSRSLWFGDWVAHIVHAQFGPIGYIRDITAAYRINSNSATRSTDARKRISDVIKMYEGFDDYFNSRYSRMINLLISRELCSLARAYEENDEHEKALNTLKESFSRSLINKYMGTTRLKAILRVHFPKLFKLLKRRS